MEGPYLPLLGVEDLKMGGCRAEEEVETCLTAGSITDLLWTNILSDTFKLLTIETSFSSSVLKTIVFLGSNQNIE